jgi:hypothetical protein
MKILHISHSGLPDPRIERLASMSNPNVESHFLGGGRSDSQLLPDAFSSVTNVPWFSTASNAGLPYYFEKLKRGVAREVSRIAPDIIYAHNIISAKVASGLSQPFIYDDHEFWSRQVLIKRTSRRGMKQRLKNGLRSFWLPKLYRRWELEVLKKASAVVTVSKAIADEHQTIAGDCHVIPNFPLKRELKSDFQPKAHTQYPRAICLAADFEGFLEHRHPGNNREIIEEEGGIHVDWVGRPPPEEWNWFSHREWIEPSSLIEVLTNDYQFGLIPWRDYWYHQYSMPNKAASYSHAGLIFILNRDFTSIIHLLPEFGYHAYSSPEELRQIVRDLRDIDAQELLQQRLRLKKWAARNLFLDKYSEILRTAIELAEGDIIKN